LASIGRYVSDIPPATTGKNSGSFLNYLTNYYVIQEFRMVYEGFEPVCLPNSHHELQTPCLAFYSTLKMEAVLSTEMLMGFMVLHSLTSQKVELFIGIALRTSNSIPVVVNVPGWKSQTRLLLPD
jgi:hypothetical protein